MKHLLLATTALVAFAGAAAAEVTVTGETRLGLRYDSNAEALCPSTDPTDPPGTVVDCTDDAWNVVNRARAIFTMSGETDTGLSFGATFRADTAENATQGNSFGEQGNVWISGAYGRLSAGDVDAAIENAVGDLPEIGLTELNNYNEMTYSTTDIESGGVDIDGDGDIDFTGDYNRDATLLYEYQFGDASIYASFTDEFFGNTAIRKGSSWSLGAGYQLGNYSFGIGYEDAEYFVVPLSNTVIPEVDAKTWGISGGTSISGITFKAIYLTSNVEDDDGVSIGGILFDDADVKQYGLGAEYVMANGIGLGGYWRRVDIDATGAGVAFDAQADAYGIGASYDLGGGAVLKGGIARVDSDEDVLITDNTIADFGVEMTF